MEITLQLCFVFVRHCDVFLLRYNYANYLFDVVTFELRLEILRHNDVALLCHNHVIYLFNVVTFVDNVRITLYFGTFELLMEITLQLCFVFGRHCDAFFCYVAITLFICSL